MGKVDDKVGSLPTKPRRTQRELWERTILAYGVPKIGKSTFFSKFPNPLFISTEDGLGTIEVHETLLSDELCEPAPGVLAFGRVDPKTKILKPTMSAWEYFRGHIIHDLRWRDHDFKTVVIDTIPNLFQFCVNYLNVQHGVKYENDGVLSYGKGQSLIEREFGAAMQDLAALKHERSIGIVFVAHTEEREKTDKGKTQLIVRNSLPRRPRTIINGMVDMILYFTYDNQGNRIIQTRGDHLIEAGSRVGDLAPVIPMDYEKFVEAYTVATNGTGSGDAREELITRIHTGERVLSERKIDSFDVEKRMLASREKHTGNRDLTQCGLAALQSYLQHLQGKFKKGSENGTSA